MMIPAKRLRLILGRALDGVPAVSSPSFELGDDIHDYLLKGYMRETATNEKLTELLSSVSSLGIASQEDWLRLKKICFSHLPELSCRTVNRLFALLVEKNVCGNVECVKIQDKLAQLNFSKNLRDHECLETLRCIANVGSRLSPSFIPHALESIGTLVKKCQTELLPILSYSIGRILTSKENKGIPSETQHALLQSLLVRVESIDCMLLSQSELIYLLWSLSAFCSPIVELRPAYLTTLDVLLHRGIHLEEIKDASPMDLLLLLCGLCPLLECSGVANAISPSQETGLIVAVITDYCEVKGASQGFLKWSLKVLDIVLFALVQHVARGELQNRQICSVTLEMITCSGTTKLLKNAQILFHLLLRTLMYGEKGMWFCDSKRNTLSEEENQQHPLVNYFLFDKRMNFMDILTTRLSMSLLSSAHLQGFEKASVREVIVVLEALANGNLSESLKNLYLQGCMKKLPWAVRVVSRNDFFRIVNSVMKLRISDKAVMRAIQDRCQEIGVENQLIDQNTSLENGTCRKETQIVTADNWNSDIVTLYICEKSLQLLEQDKSCTLDVPTLMENLSTRKGMRSATETHCVSIIMSLARHHHSFKKEKVYQSVLTSIFSRVRTRLPLATMLSFILDGIKAGVSCEALSDAISWAGCQLLDEDPACASPKDVATYFIAAHELNSLGIVAHPALLGFFQREKTIDMISPLLAARFFAAICALGVDDTSLLKSILNRVELWCLDLLEKIEWSEEDWKASLVLVHALWTSASEVVWNQLMQIAHKLISSMIEQGNKSKTEGYSLLVASAAATFSIQNDPENLSTKGMQKGFEFEQLPAFLKLVTSLFSEDGITFSLSRTDALLRTGVQVFTIPQYGNITCFLIIAHAVQRLAQSDHKPSKKLTPLGVSLWRYCLKHVERTPLTDNTLMTAVGFSIRFGASSQAFDRFMSALMEREESNVNLLSVCFIADGLVRTCKRRSVATQFVAHFSQRNSLDDLPASALLSLLVFFMRDAERVSLGLTRADMLIALVWSSISLKLVRLPETKKLWTLVESVPVESRPVLLCFLGESGLIDKSSVSELFPPVSTVLGWQLNSTTNFSVKNFLEKVKASLDIRGTNENTPDLTAEELLKKISGCL